MRVKTAKLSWGCNSQQTLQLYLEQAKFVYQLLALLEFFPVYNNIFPIINQTDCFTSGIGPDIPMNVFEDCIIFLICAA